MTVYIFKPFLLLRLNPGSELFLGRHYLCYLYFNFFPSNTNYHQPVISPKSPYVCTLAWVSPCLYVVVACTHVCGKGGTHCLLLCCHWAASPDQQPCRPDRRWARLPLQLILCSPSAAPDSAGRSPLEEGRWSGESKGVGGGGRREGKKKGGREGGKERETVLVSVVDSICGETRCGREKMLWRKSDVLLCFKIRISFYNIELPAEVCERLQIRINPLTQIRNFFS